MSQRSQVILPTSFSLIIPVIPLVLGSAACGDDSVGESASAGSSATSSMSSGSGASLATTSTSAASTDATTGTETDSDSDSDSDSDGDSDSNAETDAETATGTTDGALVDDAELIEATLPEALACGAALTAEITLRNSGSTTWSRAQGYAFGAVNGADPLVGEARVDLPQDLEIAPRDSYTFTLDLVGPEVAAEYPTQWQMFRGDPKAWFGEPAAAAISVACPEEPPPDLDQVIWLHTDVSAWEETMTLESITFEGGLLCLNHSSQDEGVYVWPEKEYGVGTWVVGNPWIFIEHGGQWYAATWEWLRPDQTCKAVTSVAGDHIKVAPFDANSRWKPTSGETYYFMVSALARQTNAVKNVEERSNLVKLVWP